jgi:hypothetical protein
MPAIFTCNLDPKPIGYASNFSLIQVSYLSLTRVSLSQAVSPEPRHKFSLHYLGSGESEARGFLLKWGKVRAEKGKGWVDR